MKPPLLRWSRGLATVLLLAGCKSKPPAPAVVPDAGVAALPSPQKAARPEPWLSYLQEGEPERCAWMRQPLPSGPPITLFTFEASCTQSQLAWSPDGSQGLVHTWPSGEGARERVWRVDFAAKAGQVLDVRQLPGATQAPGPDVPYIEQVGFDAQNRPVALLADVYTQRVPEKGPGDERFLVSEGQRYPLSSDKGSPGVASAYRLEGTQWKRFEAKASFYETDDAPGASVLDASKGMLVLNPSARVEPLGQRAPPSDASRLDTALPGQEASGQWWVLTTPGGKLYYRAAQRPDDESRYEPTTPVRWDHAGGLLELEGLKDPEGTPLRLQLQGERLLVSVRGAPGSAHVFDTRTRKSLVSLPNAESALLGPLPPRP